MQAQAPIHSSFAYMAKDCWGGGKMLFLAPTAILENGYVAPDWQTIFRATSAAFGLENDIRYYGDVDYKWLY